MTPEVLATEISKVVQREPSVTVGLEALFLVAANATYTPAGETKRRYVSFEELSSLLKMVVERREHVTGGELLPPKAGS